MNHSLHSRFTLLVLALLATAALSAQCPNPPTADAGPDQTINCTVFGAVLVGSSDTPNAAFGWTGPNGFASTGPTITAPTGGTYTLTVTDPATGCSATDQALVISDLAPFGNGHRGDIELFCYFCNVRSQHQRA